MAAKRERILTGTIWEERNGYARAVKVGPHIFVSGTLAADEGGNILHPGAPHLQTLAALEKIEIALKGLGASRSDVVRTRIYVTSIRHDQEVGRAHLEFFGDLMPCCTMVEVSHLASPLAEVEVEVDALVAAEV
jgi:enamine deaminase RidA (YjgF/YER057c/UK114 family)